MGDDRMIPGLSVYCLKASDFEVSIRPALDQGGNALFGEDEKQVRVGQKEHLPIAISIRPPVAFAGFRVEADEGAAVEAVNVPFVEEHVVLVGPWMERRRPCTANDSGRSIGVDERADPFHDINQKVVVIKLCYKRHTAITVVERLYLMGV
jgi:hypothetical protein